MIPVGLNLKNKNVLIVGAGKVALRKAKLFLAHEAKVFIVSPQLIDELLDLDVTCLIDYYHKEHLKGMFLVYACTNDQAVNHQIVEDCNELNILCGSATRDKNVSFNSMAFEETKVGMVALSTHQKMPYTKPLLSELKETLQSKQEQLEKLSVIREYLVETKQVNTDLFNQMYGLSIDVLDFICQSIKEKKGYIFVYHQSKFKQQYGFDLNPSIIMDLKTFESTQNVLSILKNTKVVPLLLSDGFIYQKLKKMTTLEVLKPLVNTNEDIQKVICLLRSDNKTNIWLMHPRSQSTLLDQFKSSVPENDIVQTFDDELKFEANKNYHVVVLLMTEGQHYHDLVQKLPNHISISKILPLEKCVMDLMVLDRDDQ